MRHWRDNILFVKLGEISDIIYGKGLPTKKLLDTGYPVFGANGQIGFYNEYLFEDEQLLISCRGAYSGKINFSSKKCYITNNSLVVDFPIYKNELRKYFFYALQGANRSKIVTGSAQPQVTINNVVSLEIPIPPLPEQRAIVAKIEQLFSDLDNGIASLKAAQDQLKVYRQAVLKKPFEANENNIKCLISDVTEKIQIGPFGSQLHKKDYIEGGIPLINPMHIQGGKILPNSSYTISRSKRDSLPNYILKTGDIIMGRRGEMGRCSLVSQQEDGWFCGTGSLYFRPNFRKAFSPFLYYYLQSVVVKKLLTSEASGTTMANLNKKIVSNIPLYLPSLKEQNQIVQEIESRLSVCDKVEETIKESLKKAEALRQSILKKAFEGRLLSEAESVACREEDDWEPAEVLLERIKREKSK